MTTKYYVNKEKGAITAVIELTKEEKNILFYNTLDLKSLEIPRASLNRIYTGIAKLTDGDIWDEEWGKKLAFKKAHNKYMKHRANLCIQYQNDVLKDLDEFRDNSYKYLNAAVTSAKDLREFVEKKYGKETEDIK